MAQSPLETTTDTSPRDFAISPDSGGPSNGGAKRRHSSHRRAMTYPRKRAVAACQRCRARKTKCDNQRPSCGFCIGVNAHCQYDEASDHSSFDPASLQMLSRLNQILAKQDDVLKAVSGFASPQVQAQQLSPANASVWSATTSYQTANAAVPDTGSSGLKIPSSRTNPDLILAWPVFQGQFACECLQEAIFESEKYGPDIGHDDDRTGSTGQRSGNRAVTFGLQESQIVNLVDRFLSLVHTKNPILDDDSLRRQAETIAEDGLSWDGPSCLVLLACALGTIASPFEIAISQIRNHTNPEPQHQINTGPDLRMAESYYQLARRRIGLLRPTIMASQCYFLSGVYLMYALRPMEAFHEFHQASIVFQLCLKCTQRSFHKSIQSQRLEQRMYWSCFKSECEILSEIPLPESGIADFEYPHMFPSPPDPSGSVYSPEVSASTPEQQSFRRRGQEQSWYYYLSEIALRRIANRVLNTFYREEHQSWLTMDISAMVGMAADLMRQLDQWHAGLPSLLDYEQTDLSQIPMEELPFMIRTRVLEIRSWIFRPFLFHAVHRSTVAMGHSSLAQQVDRALLDSICLIENNSLRHRHHGTWYMCRVSVSAALSILAAAKVGYTALPLGWRHSVQLAIETLQYWEQEAPGDLRLARVILQGLYADVAADPLVHQNS